MINTLTGPRSTHLGKLVLKMKLATKWENVPSYAHLHQFDKTATVVQSDVRPTCDQEVEGSILTETGNITT